MNNNNKKPRMSSNKKTEIVLELLRGSSIEVLSRQNKVAVHQLSEWREQFIKNGSTGFKKQPKETKVSQLEHIIGRQHTEIELLKKRKTAFGKAKGSS